MTKEERICLLSCIVRNKDTSAKYIDAWKSVL